MIVFSLWALRRWRRAHSLPRFVCCTTALLDLCSRCSFSIVIKLENLLLSHFEHHFTIATVKLAIELYAEYVVLPNGLNGLI